MTREEEYLTIPNSLEITYDLYIDGFDSIEKLEALFVTCPDFLYHFQS